ncbi:MAG: alpha/beta hydrolase, partial [Gammaproteobacteria bacterium]|nr:alpha/beta hydrolase [Gammaproteobacteria bacterium]
PNAPELLCGGALDPVVFWFNAQLMQSYWSQHVPAAPVGLLDLESSASAQDPYAALKQGFEAAKAAVAADAVAHGATDGGAAAVFTAYHATLVAPFCLAAARSFIAGH